MRDFLLFLKENAFSVVMAIVLIILAIGFAGWMQKPSPFAKSNYVECLRTVLAVGTINDAETMCQQLRVQEAGK